MTAATSSDLTSSSSIASAIDFVGQLDLILSRSSLQAIFSPNSSQKRAFGHEWSFAIASQVQDKAHNEQLLACDTCNFNGQAEFCDTETFHMETFMGMSLYRCYFKRICNFCFNATIFPFPKQGHYSK